MENYIRYDELMQRTNLGFDEVQYLVDQHVPETKRNGDELLFNEKSIKTFRLIENFLNMGYCLEDTVKIINDIGEPKESNDSPDERRKRHLYTPGELAKLFNVSPRAVKYWEEKKLIKPHFRTKTGIRFYHKKTIIEIMLLKAFQDLGFKLDEIKIFLDLYHFVLMGRNKKKSYEKARDFLRKLDELDLTLSGYESSIESLKQLSSKGRQKLNVIVRNESFKS